MHPSAGPEVAAWPLQAAQASSGRPRRGRLAGWAGLILGAAALTFLAGFGLFVARLDRSEREPAAVADGIVALTGGAGRIGDAIDLLAKGYAGRLLITGVNERTTRDEIARLNPHQRRLVECCVDLDYRARDTVGNAVETAHWARRNGFESLIVVTSNYHMARSLVELARAMPEARTTPFPVVPGSAESDGWWAGSVTARRLLVEYAKYVAASARKIVASVATADANAPASRSVVSPTTRLAKDVPAR